MKNCFDLGWREPIVSKGEGPEETRMLFGNNEFMHQYIGKLRELDACLEKWLGVPLLFDEQEKASALILGSVDIHLEAMSAATRFQQAA